MGKSLNTIDNLIGRIYCYNGCWETDITSKATGGYPTYGMGGRLTSAATHMYEYFFGPVPIGLELDHVCCNKECINPLHLEPVTHRENVRRRTALITHCPQKHAYNLSNTYIDPRGNRQCRECRNVARLKSMGFYP